MYSGLSSLLSAVASEFGEISDANVVIYSSPFTFCLPLLIYKISRLKILVVFDDQVCFRCTALIRFYSLDEFCFPENVLALFDFDGS